MGAIANESLHNCSFIGEPFAIGLLRVAIGVGGAPTVTGPCAGITVTRASAGTYDFVLPTPEPTPRSPNGFAVIVALSSSSTTVIGFQRPDASRIVTLVETAGVIAPGDPSNGDFLTFLVFCTTK